MTGKLPAQKVIFRDLTANPDDPSNYTWDSLDEKLRKYAESYIKPYILLTISTPEIAKIKRGKKTPQWLIDNRWNIARSLARILYHITSSDHAWSGQGIDVDYVELWNEPCVMNYWVDPRKHWPRKRYSRNCYPCFVDIIERTISDIRELCGYDIRIGAWAGAPFPNDGLNNKILGEMSRRRVPLDFYSWHDYRKGPQLWDFHLLESRISSTCSRLQGKGYYIPQHITEWNSVCFCLDDKGNCAWCSDSPIVNPWYRTIKSAAYTAEYLINAQDLPVKVTCRWDGGKDPYGLWNENGSYRYPVFYTYKLFSKLIDNRRIKTQADEYFVLAGKSGDGVNILIACDEYNNSKDGYHLFVDDIPSSFSYTVTKITKKKRHGGTEIIQSGPGKSFLDLRVPTEDYAVHLVEINFE